MSETDVTEPTPPAPARTLKERLGSFAAEFGPLVVGLFMVLVVRTVVAEPFTVPSASMVPTLLVGDKLLASKWAYGFSRYSLPIGALNFAGRIMDRAPVRGDVVVFKLPRDTSINYVKRLIGLPGDHIQMKEGRLYINGEIVARRDAPDYTTMSYGHPWTLRHYIETLPGGRDHEILESSDAAAYDDTDEYVVPAEHYFMMGDNRDDSLDSRVSADRGGVDYVPAENLVGRVDRVVYSRDQDVSWHWDAIPAWIESFRDGRFFTAIH